MSKQAFKDTKFGKFLNKAKDVVPELAGVGIKLVTGNVSGAVEEVGAILKNKAVESSKIRELSIEFERDKMQFEKDCFALEVQDRDSARKRQVEMAKTGKIDWMMYATGFTVLGLFITCVLAVLFMEIKNRDLAHVLIGEIIGLALCIVAYYFGTSKSSREKNDLIKKLNE